MKISSAQFVISSKEVGKCPTPDMPEYAFIGRSNVGKSSLINMITNRSELARTSAKPGKTQLINHFIINKNWYMVDLPGYGYAKVDKTSKAQFDKMISSYILKRKNLMCVFVLIDSRHPMQNIDKEFMISLAENEVPFALIFTKLDKLKPKEVEKNIENYKKSLLEYWEEIPTSFLTSSVKKKGADEILDFIEKGNKKFKAN